MSKQYITLPYSESKVLSKCPAPTGLPRSCYDDEWLQGLTLEQKKDLQMTE